MKFTYYGHSTFSIDVQGKKILFDPFFTGNPAANGVSPDSIEADYIFITHAHHDHTGDAVSIAIRTGATCVGPYEVMSWLGREGVTNILPMNHGAFINFPFGKARGVNAIHSSAFDDGAYGGNPMGFVFSTSEGDFYYAGDTALTMDMQLIPLWAKLSFAILPIGGHFTMDVTDALHASNFAKADRVVGVHYNTFGFITIDKEASKSIFQAAGKTLLLPDVGSTIEL